MTASWAADIRFVLFDAVGTVLRPEPSVGQAYYAAGLAAGSQLSSTEVSQRFRREFARQFGGSRGDQPTSDTLERQRWRAVIAAVFDDVADIDQQLFPALWQHFGDSQNWRWFDDALAAWTALQSFDLTVGLASNYDSRLSHVCGGLPPLDRCPHIFASSELGWAKPSVEFFRAIERQLDCAPPEILLVGDDFAHDYLGAGLAGWRSLWLDRERSEPPAPLPPLDRIASLRELPERLGLDFREGRIPHN